MLYLVFLIDYRCYSKCLQLHEQLFSLKANVLNKFVFSGNSSLADLMSSKSVHTFPSLPNRWVTWRFTWVSALQMFIFPCCEEILLWLDILFQFFDHWFSVSWEYCYECSIWQYQYIVYYFSTALVALQNKYSILASDLKIK